MIYIGIIHQIYRQVFYNAITEYLNNFLKSVHVSLVPIFLFMFLNKICGFEDGGVVDPPPPPPKWNLVYSF